MTILHRIITIDITKIKKEMECVRRNPYFFTMKETSQYEEIFKIRSFNIDYFGRLRMSALFNFLMECAGLHARQLNVGYDQLQPLNLFWVLSRVKLHIRTIPRWHDDITVRTWPKGFHKLFALRDFQVFDSSQNEIISATSCWLLIDKTSLRPQRYDRLPAEIRYDPDHQAITERPEKLTAAGTLISAHTRQAAYSELDVNHHLNNSRYVEWIMDGFDIEWHRNHRIGSFQLNFTEEIKPGQSVDIRLFMGNGTATENYIEGIKSSGTTAFQSTILWK